MKSLVLATGVLFALPALAEMRDEEHLVGDQMVKITVVESSEILTVGPSDHEQMQVLSGADIEIVALASDAGSVALLGQPVLVAEVTGTHSCEDGDAREYWVVTLGEAPAPVGPVTTCEAMAASVTTPGWVLLKGEADTWAWAPGKPWAVPAN